MYLVSVASVVSGSPSYVRLRYEIEALASAQEGVKSMDQGLKDLKVSTELYSGLSAVITSTNDANDSLRCAAAVMGHYAAKGDDDRTIRTLLMQGFNQEAGIALDMQDDIKRKLLGAVNQSTANDALKEAERMSAIQAKQKYAGESLTLAVSASLLMAVDLSNTKAKNTTKTMLSCSEFEDLRKKSAAIMNGPESTYSDDASLFTSFFNSHECLTAQ
jgi:hypothetical protein